MIKKIILVLMFSFILISCGKKGDPIYKNSEKLQKNKVFL
jgi:hypothetical protein